MGGMGMGGMGMGGFFNVGPDRVAKLKVQTVCLEHGKEDPNPRVPYALRPIESFTQKAELIELCKMLGRGEIDQVSAQAAAWHLSDGLSWQELAQKIKINHLNGQTELFFNAQQLQQALRVVRIATERTRGEPTPGTRRRRARVSPSVGAESIRTPASTVRSPADRLRADAATALIVARIRPPADRAPAPAG